MSAAGPSQGAKAPSGLSPAAPVLPAQDGTGQRAAASGCGMSSEDTPVPSVGVDTVLSCQGLVKRFGGISATQDVTLNLARGARHALIGPNGAGKTTLINLLTGV